MYAVIDTETTGLSPNQHHRVVEIAVVLVDGTGRIEREWSTLLNPDRDLGPQHIHGIAARDVLDAPRFAQVAGHLRQLLAGRVLVAHNLPFDLSFLIAEYARLGVTFPVGWRDGVCTMGSARRFLPGAGRSLRDCCAAAGITLTGWHSAAADSRATAGLLAHYIGASVDGLPWLPQLESSLHVVWPTLEQTVFTTRPRRGATHSVPFSTPTLLDRLADYMPRVDSTELADPYLAVLDQALADRYMSADESAALAALASCLGLTANDTSQLHHDYLGALARLALADGHLADHERADLDRVSSILGFSNDATDEALTLAGHRPVPSATNGGEPLTLACGSLVVFTGDMIEPRDVWETRARAAGLIPHSGVTKKISVVVAADPDTLSGKGKKARGYGIPIITTEQFLLMTARSRSDQTDATGGDQLASNAT